MIFEKIKLPSGEDLLVHDPVTSLRVDNVENTVNSLQNTVRKNVVSNDPITYNLFDEVWRKGWYNVNGDYEYNENYYCNVNPIDIEFMTRLRLYGNNKTVYCWVYDSNMNLVERRTETARPTGTILPTVSGKYMNVFVTSVVHESDGFHVGVSNETLVPYSQYEPYADSNSVISEKLGYHISDNGIHVTPQEKSNWNNASAKVSEMEKEAVNIDALNILGWVIPDELLGKGLFYKDSDGNVHIKIGRVDLGSLAWVRNSTYPSIYSVALPNGGSNRTVRYGYSYNANIEFGYSTQGELADNSIYGTSYNNNIYAKYTTVSGVEELRSLFSGKYLYYELANETIVSAYDTNAIDNSFMGGDAVDLSAYNSPSNQYTFPKDGYVQVTSNTSTSGHIYVRIGYGNRQFASVYMETNARYTVQSVFVKKGMSAYVYENTSNGSASSSYTPLI